MKEEPNFPPPSGLDLPSYGESNAAAAADNAASSISGSAIASSSVVLPSNSSDNQSLKPTTLYVAGRFIYTNDPEAPPLYEFSHSVGFLRDTDRSVSVNRLEHSIKQIQGVPEISTRNRHIYDLKHPTRLPPSAFSYYGESTSRQTQGFGISTFRARTLSSSKGYEVKRASIAANKKVVDGQDVFLRAIPARDAAVSYEWSNADDELLAREVDQDGLVSLVIGVEMEARTRDMLVSAWIARMWWELANGNHRGRTWDNGQYISPRPSHPAPIPPYIYLDC